MSSSLTGGCQCGAVRYECTAEPLFTGNCHCRDCQRSTGSAYVPALAVPARALKITGDVKYYDSRADSGHTFSRGFCPNCGGRLFGKTSAMPRFMLITAGSLDDPRTEAKKKYQARILQRRRANRGVFSFSRLLIVMRNPPALPEDAKFDISGRSESLC